MYRLRVVSPVSSKEQNGAETTYLRAINDCSLLRNEVRDRFPKWFLKTIWIFFFLLNHFLRQVITQLLFPSFSIFLDCWPILFLIILLYINSLDFYLEDPPENHLEVIGGLLVKYLLLWMSRDHASVCESQSACVGTQSARRVSVQQLPFSRDWHAVEPEGSRNSWSTVYETISKLAFNLPLLQSKQDPVVQKLKAEWM